MNMFLRAFHVNVSYMNLIRLEDHERQKKTTYNLIYIHGIIEKCRFFREFRVNKEAICKMVNNIVSR